MKKLLVLALAIPLASVASAAPTASGPVTLSTPGPVTAFAADGKRAALTIRRRGRWQILVWEPAAHRLLTIHTESDTDPGGSVALAGGRVAWDEWYGGLTITTRVSSATLARRAAVSLGSDDGTDFPSGARFSARAATASCSRSPSTFAVRTPEASRIARRAATPET